MDGPTHRITTDRLAQEQRALSIFKAFILILLKNNVFLQFYRTHALDVKCLSALFPIAIVLVEVLVKCGLESFQGFDLHLIRRSEAGRLLRLLTVVAGGIEMLAFSHLACI